MEYRYWKKYLINGVIILGVLVVLAFLGISLAVNKNSQQELQGELLDHEGGEQDYIAMDRESDIWEGFLDISLILMGAENGSEEGIKLFVQSEKGYFFLPSYWEKDKLIISFDDEEYEIKIDGRGIRANEPVSFADNTTYELTVTDSEVIEKTYFLTIMQSQNLPAIFVSTYNETMEYINDEKGNYEPGGLICIENDGSVDCEGKLERVKLHGNTSATCPKKTYQIQFENHENLLKMGEAQKWILQANTYDGSYMRNKLAYDIALKLGLRYAIEANYADVYFNNEYAGNYLICEKVEKGLNRVCVDNSEIEENRDEDIAEIIEQDGYKCYEYMEESEYTGGYIVEAQNLIVNSDVYRMDEDACYFTSDFGRFEVVYPEKASKSEVEYISEYVRLVGQLITACDSAQKYEQLKQYIDTDSFATMYLVDMLTNEVDSNDYSTFYYKYPEAYGGKLCAGPAWDFDTAFGNERRNQYLELNGFPDGFCEILFQNEQFQNEVREKIDLFEVGDFWSELPLLIEPSVKMDEVRWSNNEDKLNYSYTTFRDEVAYLEYYFEKRYELVKEYLYENENYCTVTFVDKLNRSKKYFIRQGEMLPNEILSYMRQECNCDAWCWESGKNYNSARPVFSDIILYAKNNE